MTYADYLTTPHWRTFRRLVLERDDYRCVLCGNFKNLHVHHRDYHSGQYNEKLNDCYTLCEECHTKFHGKKITKQLKPRKVKLNKGRKSERNN